MDEFKEDLTQDYDDLFALAAESNEVYHECPIFDTIEQLDSYYENWEEIGRGGMKCVYKVFDERLNRHVALAKLHPDTPSALYDPFIREARLIAKMAHPNIISVYEVGVNKDRSPYLPT